MGPPRPIIRRESWIVKDDAAKPICGTASANVVLDPFGNVLPCVQWRRPLGNVREQSLEEIWLRGGEAQTAQDGYDP